MIIDKQCSECGAVPVAMTPHTCKPSDLRRCREREALHECNPETPKRRHAEKIRLYAEDWADTDKPWERWQSRVSYEDEWRDLTRHPAWPAGLDYRRKPDVSFIKIGEIEVQEPCREPLEDGQTMWTVAERTQDLVRHGTWTGNAFDRLWLERGLVHLTRAAALVHAMALVKVSGGEV